MRALALACALCALGASLAAAIQSRPAGAAEQISVTARQSAAEPDLIAQIEHYRKVTWHWQQVMGVPRTDTNRTAQRSPDRAYRRWVLRLWKHRAHRVQAKASRWLVVQAHAYQKTVAHWQHVMGIRATPTRHTASASPSLRYRAWVYRLWKQRAAVILKKAEHPPHEAAWRCIHRYEGSWTDTGRPYYGGLQMDLSFQRHYGAYLLRAKGTADNWTPLEQMWVAAKALRSGRGFYPWPNTARMCGLI